MKEIVPGTLVHYNEIARLMSKYSSKLSGNYAAINAHIGGQFFFSPHKMALEAHVHHTINHTSLLGYLSSLSEKEAVSLSELLKRYCPENGFFIDLYKAYQDLWKKSSLKESSFDIFLDYQKKQKVGSTGYLDYSAGQLESLALMKKYFQNMGIPVLDNQVVMGTGYKNLYHTLLNVLMTKDVTLDEKGRDLRKRDSGTILVPRGHYQSLVKAPSWHNSRLKVVERMDGENIKKELEDRGDIKAIYFSVVANPSGEVMPEKQIREISEVVLEYNEKNSDNPVFVIADQVYNGSILKSGVKIFSIASLIGENSKMFDYTITIVSPSKTLGYASARIGFATSGAWIPGDKSSIISRMEKALDNEGCDGIEVSNEVGVVAAYSFSSQKWIDDNSSYIKSQLERARQHVTSINNSVGYQFLEINNPDAGWYILSKFKRKNLPSLIKDSTDLMVFFMNYNHCAENSGFICRPGSQFGYEAVNLPPMDFLILRSTLAMKSEDLDDFFRRFKEAILKLAALKELEMMGPEKVESFIMKKTAENELKFILKE
ncbi:MAG: pyridoxal phosphate-dependent aminotransferase [Spirochaetia bacterium]|nr:pyridoxal phosphate-dependent aminotransferase [Spirochaetia bacterium]